MIVKVFENKVTKDREQEFFLKMKEVDSGVEIVLVNERGGEISAGTLLRINSDMTLYRYEYINSDLGLPLDDKNRLKLGEMD